MKRVLWLTLVTMLFGVPSAIAGDDSEWIEAMKKVHEGFSGTKGYVAQFGDSITYSMAFWTPVGWKAMAGSIKEDDGLPKKPGKMWKQIIKGARDKGGKNANYSGWRIGQLLPAAEKVLASKKPEVALIMIGTNDVRGNKVPAGYEAGLDKLLVKTMEAKCIPILSTIPPMRGKDAGVKGANEIIHRLAKKHKVPLIDFYAEIIKRRPNDWDGTLISRDGVHPSGGKVNDFSEANMTKSGYALRTWLSFMAYRKVYFKVIDPQ